MSDEEKDPMVIHDAIDKVVYTPKMEGGHNPEEVAARISEKLQKIHDGGLRKEDFFPTFLVTEMADEKGHSWAADDHHLGFIYGYTFGYMLANYEKNKGTKLVWDKRDMTPEEIEETQEVADLPDLTNASQQEIDKFLEDLSEKMKNQEESFNDDLGFDPPEPWSPDSEGGYDPTK